MVNLQFIIKTPKMKKNLSLAFAVLITLNLHAQTVVNDSVTMGAGYANQIWYSMQNGEVSQAPNNNWEIAFTTKLMGASALANTAQGVAVFMVPNTDLNGFSTLDTTGYLSWQMLRNSETTWNLGAFNQNMTVHPNYGWGTYDQVTHIVTGDSLFLVRTGFVAPYTFKKLWLIKKDVTGDWIFRFANLDNTNDVTDTVLLSNYSGKNFSYYSLTNQSELNREPTSDNWDLTFTRYTSEVTGIGFYNVTGVLGNVKILSAQANQIDVNTVDFINYQSQLDSNISIIGYDWKFFDGTAYVIEDSMVYFVKDNNGAIWQLQFTSFTSSIGKAVFNKKMLTNVGYSDVTRSLVLASIFPNPSSGNSSLLVSSDKSENASFNIYNAVGELIMIQNATVHSGINSIGLNTVSFENGIYFIKNSQEKNSAVLKLVIAR